MTGILGIFALRSPLRPQHRTASRKLPKLAAFKQRQLPPDGTELCAELETWVSIERNLFYKTPRL